MICEICQKNKIIENIIHESKHWILTLGPSRVNIKGYFYLAPKRHVENWQEFNEEEMREMGFLIQKAEFILNETIKIERLYSVTISEELRHIHIHLIPREETGDLKGLKLIEKALAKI